MSLETNIGELLIPDFLSDESGEMIPLLSPEEEDEMNKEAVPNELAILPIRNTVLFPGVVLPITVGRKASIQLVKDNYNGDKIIGVVTQKNGDIEDPSSSDVYTVGTIAKIVKMLVLPDGNTTIIIQGKKRFEIKEFTQESPYFRATTVEKPENYDDVDQKQKDALIRSLKEIAKNIVQLNPEMPPEAEVAIDNIETPGFLTHFLSSNINADVKFKQTLLEIDDGYKRSTTLLEMMTKEMQLLELKRDIQSKVHTDIDQQQRDYFLRQQMKVLQDELGEDSPEKDLEHLLKIAELKQWPAKAKEHFEKEVRKLRRMNPSAADYPVTMNYIELLTELPWDEISDDNFDLKNTKKILDDDHYGLEKVKDRIIEYLAVLKLKNKLNKDGDKGLKGPILCLYGPPGVGKTSLGRSIAKSLGREYVRMSLGGVSDEAEIRGHRKTYIGAMPGKVIQNIKKAGKSNPVFILDEIDKLRSDMRGDPSSALLEVLDPEQNKEFIDNYLEIEYDLSQTLFIATSNALDTIQPALRDRMEIIELTGYTREEKVEIAKRHLIRKQKEENGVSDIKITFAKVSIEKLIDAYTRESGVRELNRKIGTVLRNVAKSIALEEEIPEKITPEYIREVLGPEIFEKESYENIETAGIVTGLAWTPVGGEILTIESLLSKGKGKLTLSGTLGDVMKESAMAALSNLKSNADGLNIDHRVFDQFDLHLHFPAGAVPKDGPSAGITIYTSLASLYTQRQIKPKIAMTGELTLSGKVLPVGGIKEKILAAKRAGIKEVIMCYKNEKDLEEINPSYIKGLKIHFVKHVSEVIEIALLDKKVKKPFDLTIEEKESKSQ